ncbi:hypothetical protein SteCoe_21511 [Stentor coeruleus]|uniref:Uncharacterized protein n=1 Tax=Stentor coeruleus TaxID=5963 RepID=A0A1R2BPH3_9CILI|nr:hypothetical protein SteCoe_21511 [Stentor coeruleus]
MNTLLPIVSRVCNNKNKRLESDKIKLVVSRVRTMQKRSSPCGCSYNLNANIKDLDFALEQSKRREQDFDTYISREMKKLNCMKSRSCKKRKPKYDEQIIQENIEFIENPEDELSIIPESTYKELNNEVISERMAKTMQKIRVRTSSPILTRRSKVSQEFLTRLSTPATNYFSMTLNARPEVFQETLKADKLMNDCQKLNDDMKKIRNFRTAEEKGNNQEKAMIKEIITGKKAQVKDTNNDNYKEDQLTLDLKMAKNLMRGKKIWKLNHVSFIANVDRMINFVPQTKK